MMVNREAPLLTRPRYLHGPAGTWDQKMFRRWGMTSFIPIMWAVWGVLVLFLIALKLFNSRLTRDEDDQLILDDSFNRVKDEQAVIMAKIHRLEPLVRVSFWLVVAATLFVIGYYGVDFM